ncbi:MAG TPA: DUF192 domain-containing protein [Gemmatimonadaceae bacterium]|nr:DUF192 domain-containing protein [Gemmatimonadaceae bacterium]
MTVRIGVLGAAATIACTSGDDSAGPDRVILRFDTSLVRLATAHDTLRLVTELAYTPDQHSVGLMERRHLPDSAGMLFTYAATQPDTAAYWMYRTRLPLDIAFIDSSGAIRTIRHMVPCPTTLPEGCPSYPAGAPFRAALEVNAGYFARHGVAVGDHVLLGDTSSRLGTPRR